MPMLKYAFAALAAASLTTAAAAGERRGDQYKAYDALRAGQVKPLREIEARIVPRMGGADYLGPEFDAQTSMYRLKFMRGGSVIWIDVDARTGQVLGRSGY